MGSNDTLNQILNQAFERLGPAPKITKSPDLWDSEDWANRTPYHDALASMTLDWRGHHTNGEGWNDSFWPPSCSKKYRRYSIVRRLPTLSLEDQNRIVQAYNSGIALKTWIPFAAHDGHFGCPNCEGHSYETNGLVLRPNNKCPYPNGLVTTWEMSFPSGKIFIKDDLREVCPLPHTPTDIDTVRGCHTEILRYVDVGLAIGFGIGKTHPHLYHLANGTWEIGHKRHVPKGCVSKGVFPADVWAYSIMDFDRMVLQAKVANLDLQHLLSLGQVVDVEPGTYRFQHFHKSKNHIFARFEKVKD